MPQHTPYVVSLFNSLLTPAIAIVTTYIAWQQWKGNRLKLKLDRYDRRLRVYQEVVKMLRLVCGEAKPEWSEIMNFGASTAEAVFLFGPEIPKYIDEIITRAAKLGSATVQYRDFTQGPPPPGYDHNKIVKERTDQLTWFTEQVAAAKEKFRRYMDVSY